MELKEATARAINGEEPNLEIQLDDEKLNYDLY